jgi:hypothetical protein
MQKFNLEKNKFNKILADIYDGLNNKGRNVEKKRLEQDIFE